MNAPVETSIVVTVVMGAFAFGKYVVGKAFAKRNDCPKSSEFCSKHTEIEVSIGEIGIKIDNLKEGQDRIESEVCEFKKLLKENKVNK